jgi:hypothetical protein
MKVNLIRDDSVSKKMLNEVFEILNSVAGPGGHPSISKVGQESWAV